MNSQCLHPLPNLVHAHLFRPGAEKMLMSDERSVRRALAFASSLKHDNLTKIMGTWEADDALYIVEEYASKGDMQQVGMSTVWRT